LIAMMRNLSNLLDLMTAHCRNFYNCMWFSGWPSGEDIVGIWFVVWWKYLDGS
jgi:hypothetical protein